jgi:hypothetical protein
LRSDEVVVSATERLEEVVAEELFRVLEVEYRVEDGLAVLVGEEEQEEEEDDWSVVDGGHRSEQDGDGDGDA